MRTTPNGYSLDKPLIIGEYASVCSANDTPESMYGYFYEKEYDGAFGWHLYDEGQGHCSDGKSKTLKGIKAIKGRKDHGNISIRL